jgi:ABC-type branched-subunit amino acid transport system ATPase component/ABC-type branched-subunit amino acid transport system permease subunit
MNARINAHMDARSIAVAVAVAVVALVPLTGEYRALVGSLAVVFALIAMGFVVLTGWTGDVSFGQVVPYGVGAYGAAWLHHSAHVPLAIAVLGSAIVAVPLLVVFGVLAIRLRGLDLAVATFALALVFQLAVFRNVGRWLGGHTTLTNFSSSVVRVGRPHIGPIALNDNRALYVGVVLVGALAFVAVRALGRARFGRALLAVRDDAVRAEGLGINVNAYRLLAFVVAGMLAALAGGVGATLRGAVTPETFTIFDSLQFLAMAIVGGIASPIGAVLGGVFGAVLPELVRLPGLHFLQGKLILIYGGALVVLLALRPGGLASLFGWDRPRPPDLATPTPPRDDLPRASRVRHSLLRIDGLVVRYGAVRAVDDVDLRIGDGEAVAVIGPNGAGKSTLFEAVSGNRDAAAGRVFFAGTEITRWSPARRAAAGLGRSYQAARVFRTLTVAENLVAAAHLAAQRGESAESVAGEIAERLHLTGVATEMPGALPFGSLRSLEVGMALASRPRLLLLDEPAAGMDADEAIALCELLAGLRHELGLAVVLVEHDMAVVGRVAERVVVLDRGSVIAQGTPQQVAIDPAVIASYLGTTAARLAESVSV